MSKEKRLDALGDRMKSYERIETSHAFRPNSILYVRLDGRSFSKFTKGLNRPYDKRMSDLMIETTKYLVDEFNAVIGYTQSDEISLIIKNDYEGPCIFEGKKQKMISTLAGTASAFFNSNLKDCIPEKADKIPTFDCRIFEVPNEVEAMNAIWWRELDCVKNSVSMAAHDNFSHKELHKKNSKDMKDMLLNYKGINWDEYPDFFKYGTYVKRVTYLKKTEHSPEPVVRHRIDKLNEYMSVMQTTEGRVKFIFNEFQDIF